jgi:hypothetical protein
MRIWAQRWKAAVHAALGGKCAHCGFQDSRALQIDHVNGDGYKDAKRAPNCAGGRTRKYGSLGTYYKIVVQQADSGRYQLLCANCNWIKRDERQEYFTRG